MLSIGWGSSSFGTVLQLAPTWTFWKGLCLEVQIGATNPRLTFRLSVSLNGCRLITFHAWKSSEIREGENGFKIRVCVFVVLQRMILLTFVHRCVKHGCHLVGYGACRILGSAVASALDFRGQSLLRSLRWIVRIFVGYRESSETHEWYEL